MLVLACLAAALREMPDHQLNAFDVSYNLSYLVLRRFSVIARRVVQRRAKGAVG